MLTYFETLKRLSKNMSERRKIHFKISKQKFKIQLIAFLRKITQKHLINQNVIKAIKTLTFSN